MKERLFGTSGIRGVVNVDLTTELVMKLGLTLANFQNSGQIAVGFDTRLSSQMIAHSLISGILAGGAEVRNHGLIPTPVLAYLTHDTKATKGAMVTASHNPPEYSGIKLFDSKGMALCSDLQMQFEALMNTANLKRASWNTIHTAEVGDCAYRYIEMIKSAVAFKRELEVVVDSGCGTAHSLGPRLFRELGCKVLSINSQPDGFFPGRDPEPTAESLEVLSTVVREVGADAGIAYDGDADRMAIVDEKGAIVSMDQLIAAYGAYIVSSGKGKAIVVPIDASMCIEEIVKEAGGNVVRSAVGDVNIAEGILEHKAIFGAEASGAWINPTYHLCPDGILSSMLVIAAVTCTTTISKFIESVPHYRIVRSKVACSERFKKRVAEELQKELLKLMSEKSEILNIDGIKVSSQEEWLLVRPSGTEPVFRITVEAKEHKKAKSLMSETVTIMHRVINRFST